ncbi:hypothetical protein MHB85_19320 [Paenibacillus sp. FSL K6-4396]|uniref:hypothetical protein n=1 Tax=Paenibacillus sp. FSL K6-4396 TaxID=2921506 RepID=UPI0030F5073C
MRQFGLTYDDAVAIQSCLVIGLEAQKIRYDEHCHEMTFPDRMTAQLDSSRTMKKIAHLNKFTGAHSRRSLKKLGKLVVE